jgi:hypothetical protein
MTIQIAARVRKTHSSESLDAIRWLALDDRKSLTPPCELTAKIEMVVLWDDIRAVTKGGAIVIFPRVLALHSSLMDNDIFGHVCSLPLQVYFSFESQDADHE